MQVSNAELCLAGTVCSGPYTGALKSHWTGVRHYGKRGIYGVNRAGRWTPGMAHVQDVAAYILRKQGRITAMKLQKLCYFAYGYHLAWEERQLFPERFEAWANGPVCRELYAMHRRQLHLDEDSIGGNPDALDQGEAESVDLMLQAYGRFSAHQLSEMTHAAGPWVKARARDKAEALEPSCEPLTDPEIFEFFDALASLDADDQERR